LTHRKKPVTHFALSNATCTSTLRGEPESEREQEWEREREAAVARSDMSNGERKRAREEAGEDTQRCSLLLEGCACVTPEAIFEPDDGPRVVDKERCVDSACVMRCRCGNVGLCAPCRKKNDDAESDECWKNAETCVLIERCVRCERLLCDDCESGACEFCGVPQCQECYDETAGCDRVICQNCCCECEECSEACR
jgi:hypothetical protein